jgi:hypothetical protein
VHLVEEEKTKQSVALEAIRRFAEAFGMDPMKIRIEKQKELRREPSSCIVFYTIPLLLYDWQNKSHHTL